MKVKIGERIRDLRCERACTQEQLAKAIGISAQAVSRWEAMTGYPDIEYIPAIADYFGISIDELFGYTDTRAAQRDKRIRELENTAKDMILDPEKAEECVALLHEGISEFPSSDELWLQLAGGLATLGAKAIDTARLKKDDGVYVKLDSEYMASEPQLNEARIILERLVNKKTSGAIHNAALFSLMNLYSLVGAEDRSLKLASSQPPIIVSREVLLAQYGDGEERDRLQGEALLELADRYVTLANMSMLTKKPFDGWEHCFKHTVAMLEGLFPDGKCGKYHFTLRMLYFSGAAYSHEARNHELAKELFAKGIEHSEKYAALTDTGEYRYTAPLVSKVVHDTSKWVKIPQDQLGEWADKFPSEFTTAIRADKRFDGKL
ncbi:MAG: helix-turn-helix transcriptional regulator [Clostridia bacterium]|nr:helix-turn-helix transcriptional regulator [Clostridia bacterium]